MNDSNNVINGKIADIESPTVSKELVRIKNAMTQLIEDMTQIRGGDRNKYRIFALIISSPDPLTQEDIMKETGYSRAQVSRYLKELASSAFISKRSKPGSKTQLYEARMKSFLDTFRHFLDEFGRFLHNKTEVLYQLLIEWKKLPEESMASREGEHIKEVITVFEAYFNTYASIYSDLNQKFEERIKELEKEFMKRRI
ncbi:MAG: MarR family transcriptional regulator [Candidatus Odinarchaeota archaeon]